MKFSIALVAIFTLSCIVVAAPVNLKRMKSIAALQKRGHQSISKSDQIQPHHAHADLKRNAKHSQRYSETKRQQFAIKDSTGNYLSVFREGGSTKVKTAPEIGVNEDLIICTVENGKYAILTQYGNWLRFHPDGHIDEEDFIGGWTTLEWINNSDGTVTFKTVHGTYLRSSNSGVLVQSSLGATEKFTLVKPYSILKEQHVSFRAIDGGYLSVTTQAGALVLSSNTVNGAKEWFTLCTLAQKGLYGIRTYTGAYVTSHSGGDNAKITPTSEVLGKADTFRINENSDGTVSIQSHHGTYLRLEQVGGVTVVDGQTKLGSAEKFILFDQVKETVVSLKSYHKTFVHLSVNEGVTIVDLQSKFEDAENLTLQFLLSTNKVMLRTMQGAYLSVRTATAFEKINIQANIDSSTIFELINNSDGTYSFKSSTGTYLRAVEGGNGAIVDTQTYIGDWEKYTVITHF